MTTISLTFQVRFKEYLEACFFHFVLRFRKFFEVLKYVLIVIIGIIGWVFFGYRPFWLVMITFPLWIMILLLYASALAFKREPKYKETLRWIFTDEGILLKTKSIDSKLEWSVYNTFLETKNIFMLYYGRELFSLIPKRSFLNANEIEEFKKLARSKIPAGS